jgi:hypothetical protein
MPWVVIESCKLEVNPEKVATGFISSRELTDYLVAHNATDRDALFPNSTANPFHMDYYVASGNTTAAAFDFIARMVQLDLWLEKNHPEYTKLATYHSRLDKLNKMKHTRQELKRTEEMLQYPSELLEKLEKIDQLLFELPLPQESIPNPEGREEQHVLHAAM